MRTSAGHLGQLRTLLDLTSGTLKHLVVGSHPNSSVGSTVMIPLKYTEPRKALAEAREDLTETRLRVICISYDNRDKT